MASRIIEAGGMALYHGKDLCLCFGEQWAMLPNAWVNNIALEVKHNTREICDNSGAVCTMLIMQPIYGFTITGEASGIQWIKNPPSITDGMTVRELMQAVNTKLEKR